MGHDIESGNKLWFVGGGLVLARRGDVTPGELSRLPHSEVGRGA